MRYCLAIDIGASSGRHIVGWMENNEIRSREVYRFANGMVESGGHLTWDLEALVGHVKAGIDAALAEYPGLDSLSVDTWGVDYVLMRGDAALAPCYAYRDGRTAGPIEQVHRIVPFEALYARTGIQFEPFNTIYQLYADARAGRLRDATDFLMMPEYLMYRLCGAKAHEYTIATTTGLVNAETGAYDPEIIEALGLPPRLFGPLRQPGAVVGSYRGVKVVLCATHDTASAVEGIPMGPNDLFLSSGTWSLLGTRLDRPLTDEASRLANCSNEGGVGYIRYLKNIMGMWAANCLRAELCPDAPWDEITKAASESRFDALVDIDDAAFMAPRSMRAAFDEKLARRPGAPADYFRCAYRSLAESYRRAVLQIERNTGQSFGRLYIVGGGAKNAFLNRLTAEATGKAVVALPIEATSQGNLKLQLNRKEA